MNPRSQRNSVASLVLAGAALAAGDARGDGQVIGWGSDQFAEQPPLPATVLPFTKVSAGTAHSAALRADGVILCFGLEADGRCAVPQNLGPFKAVSAGGAHTAAIRANGVVACWGSNASLQCNVPALLGACRDVAAGGAHTVALRSDGTIAAWGANSSGQSTLPDKIDACLAVAAGGSHSAALLAGGSVVCWGSNASGQATTPPGLPPCTAIATGAAHTVALRTDGLVACWGSNANGQCNVPGGLGGCTSISAGGAHSAAIRTDGAFVGWGSNASGQVAAPAGLGPCLAVSCGGGHSMAVRRDGSLACFGAGTSDTGQSPNYGQSAVPEDLGSVVSVAGGGYHVAALRSDGRVACWGANTSGQSSVPANLSAAIAVTAGSAHTAAIRPNGLVVAWGDDSFGQSSVPGTLGPCSAISANGAGNHTVARRVNGEAACWGSNAAGQCTVPAGIAPVSAVAGGGFHSMAIRADGAVVAWGSNSFGQSVPPAGLSDAGRIAGGGYHSVALRSGGTVACWGRNGNGQCNVPVDLGPCVDVAAGVSHTVALRADGTVRAWGANLSGQASVPANLASVAAIGAGGFSSFAILDAEASSCASSGAPGLATLVVSGSVWENVGVWQWANSGPRVPGGQSAVSLGSYGSVAAGCAARAGSLQLRGGTSILVPVDASVPGGSVAGSISVSGQARLAGRIWLLGSGAAALPEDLFVPVIDAGEALGSFDIIQSTLPAPPGKFLTLVPVSGGASGVGYALALLPLPAGGGPPVSTQPGGFDGVAVAAEAMDWDGDGDDDLALAIDFGPGIPGRLQVLLNVGGNLDGANSVLRSTPPQPRCLAVGQLDDDGKPDAAVGFASDNTVRTYFNASPSTSPPFGAGTPIQLAATPLSLVIDDATALLPAFGNVIVGTAASTVQSFSSGTGGQVSAITVPTVPATMGKRGTTVATGGSASESLDPVAQPGALVRIDRAVDGTLSVAQVVPVPGIPVLLDFADIDGDGAPEVVTANSSPSVPDAGGALPVLTLFRGQGTAFGAAVPIEPAGASAGLDVVLVDADADGDRDIVSVHSTGGTQSAAAILRVDLDPTLPLPPLTIGAQEQLAATKPVLAARGNLDGAGGEDIFLVDDAPIGAFTGGGLYSAAVKPFAGGGRGGCASDLFPDGRIDGADLAELLSRWGMAGGPADLNGDGTVSGLDLGILFGDWGACPGT